MMLFVVLLALGAEPQCPIDEASCMSALLPGLPSSFAARSKEMVCNTTNWMMEDYCNKKCPMRLIITDPPELRTWMCAMDNTFEPYAPDSHIDLYHRLNNQELELEAVGDPNVGYTRLGCRGTDYAVGNKNFSGKIALTKRGGCWFSSKAVHGQASGAAMLFVVDYRPYYTLHAMGGYSTGIEQFPSMFVTRHEADYVLAALDRGVKVRGKFQYQCEDMPAGYLDNPQDYPWDMCPHAGIVHDHTCRGLDDSGLQPLCEACPVELQLPGAEKVCLYGNSLRPRKKETLMHTSWEMPYTTQQDEIVYATELANDGCSVSDYAGLSGKILLVPETGNCALVHTVRNAQDAGVKAYIFLPTASDSLWAKARAYSHHVGIPVHTVTFDATPKIQQYAARAGGRHIPGSGYALDAMVFTRGEPPPTDPPTPAPPLELVVDNRPRLDTSSDFDLSAGMVVCIAVICIDVMALVFLFATRKPVPLPSEVRVKTFSIPLKVASMGLSLTLLLLIATVTFSLTRIAGQDSTDQAMHNGRTALGLAYDSSEKNLIQVSDTVRNNVIDRMIASLRKEILSMEYRGKVVEDVFFGFDGTWVDFKARLLTVLRMMRNADRSTEDVRFMVFTTRGFFLGHQFWTDERDDSLRNDGVVGSVAETNEGWRYGVNYWQQNYITRSFSYGSTTPNYQYNASRMLAGGLGDPLSVTEGKPTSYRTWMAGKLTYPIWFNGRQPMTVYRPLYGGAGQYHGTIETHNSLDNFIETALDTPALSRGSLQNMSVVVVDDTDKAILGAYNIGTGASQQQGLVMHVSLDVMFGLYYMHEHPSIRVTALANYLDKVGGWSENEGVFDQKEHFSDQLYLTLAKISVSSGRVADTGVHNWDVAMRDGACGSCVVYDAQLQKEVLVFDGATTLQVYRNLTRRTPIVAKSQVSGPGEPWRSSYEAFGETLALGDGTECVSRTWWSTATTSVARCMLRPDVTRGSFMVSMRIRPDVAYTETSPTGTTPRLFSDSLVGDANVRLFANGQMYLFVLRYGCRTRAYEGGFPVGAWTTVTAVAGGGFCRVYVNGTLYSEGIDARKPGQARLHGNPYHSGQFFKGRMDSLQLFRYRHSEKEVSSLHRMNRLVRDVQSELYFTQTKSLDMNVAREREGVQWSVIVMIPRDDILRVVDANKRATLSDVQVQEQNTNKELTQRSNATIMVIVAIAMTSVVVFLVFNNLLTRPFEQTAAIMAEAAVLRIDSIPQGTSMITELGAMNIAIRMMLENLQLYKSFMPQSVQLTDDSSASESDNSMAGSESLNSAGRSTKSSGWSASSGRDVAGQKRQMQCSLAKKKFTYLVVNVRKWHEHTASSSEDEILRLHGGLLDSVMAHFSSNKGVSEVFSGDRFACSFNAAKVAAQHRSQATTCALQCRTTLTSVGLSLSAAAVSGEGRVGNIGNSAMRRFSFLTPLITWGYALERFACSLDVGIVIDPAVTADVCLTIQLRLLTAVSFTKLTPKPITVHEVMTKKNTGGQDEWMYELEEGEKNDPMKSWNKCAETVVSGDFEVTTAMSEVMATAEDKATSYIVSSYHSGKFIPQPILFH